MKPMRPARSCPLSHAPAGWIWQPKLNDERALMDPDGRVWNRFEERFSLAKLRQFRLPEPCGEWVDMLLVGFRTGQAREVVVIDYPGRPGGYQKRIAARVWTDPAECWKYARSLEGTEGIVGRNPRAPYCFGDSVNMVKIKWKWKN
jgi:hypothetical protein